MANDQEFGEDPRTLEDVAEATRKLRALLSRYKLEIDYVEADWKDTEELVTGAFGIHERHPDWHMTYVGGDMFGIDANYIFFTSKPVPEGAIMEAAGLIVDDGAEIDEPYKPKCPKCGNELDCLAGVFPASIPARAYVYNGNLHVDTLDGMKLDDCISDGVPDWWCPRCDERLFGGGDTGLVAAFLKGELELYYEQELLKHRVRETWA